MFDPSLCPQCFGDVDGCTVEKPLCSAARLPIEVERAREADRSRADYARPADPVPPPPLSHASGIAGIARDDKRGQVLASYRAPRWPSKGRTDADAAWRHNRRHDADHAATARAVAVLGGPPDGRPWCEAPRGDAFEQGDAAVWQALAVLACRGMRALVVRADGAGNATARRVAVRPHDEAVSHALSSVYGVAERGWRGKRGRPATYTALVAMLRAVVRRQIAAMHRVRSRFDAMAAAQRELDTLAAWSPDAAREAAREAFDRAMARAVAETRADAKNGARSRRRLADVAAEFRAFSLNPMA